MQVVIPSAVWDMCSQYEESPTEIAVRDARVFDTAPVTNFKQQAKAKAKRGEVDSARNWGMENIVDFVGAPETVTGSARMRCGTFRSV